MKHLALALAALFLAGCGDSDDGPGPAPLSVVQLCHVDAPAQMFIDTDKPVNSKSKKDAREGTIVIDGRVLQAEVRGRGNSTWGMPKKPYRFELAEPVALLGTAPARNWVLLANYADKSMLRTALAWCLGRLAGSAAVPEARYVELTLNGDYVGLYQLTWQVEVAEGRVPAVGGWMAEIDARRDGDVVIESRFGEPYVVDEDMAPAAQAALQAMEAAIADGTWRQHIDLPALRAYYLVAELSKNNDTFWSSTYLFQPAGGLVHLGPLWDFDLAFGNTDYSDAQYPQGWGPRYIGLMAPLMADDAFADGVARDWRKLSRRMPEVLQWLDQAAATLDAAQGRNFARWPILGVYVWPNAVVTGSYAGEVQYLKDWLAARTAWLDAEFAEEPKP